MIIGIAGIAGAGKDTVADYLVKEHGFIKVALADPLKRICKEVFSFSDEQLWGPSEERNKPDNRYLRWTAKVPHMLKEDELEKNQSGQVPQYLTPRHALQQLGSEWGRNCYENVWIDYALRVATKLTRRKSHRLEYTAKNGVWLRDDMRRVAGVVIPDVRFKNEVEAINAVGKVWKVLRVKGTLQGEAKNHSSEQEGLTIPMEAFEKIFTNNTTKAHLYTKVDRALLNLARRR